MDDAYCRQNRGGRKTVHSRIAICKGISSCTDMGVGLFIRNRSGRILSDVFTSFYVGLPTFLGSYMVVIYGLTQHAGLQEDVLDHRLNSRTVYMNRINRYLYWNMNYHLEHHMFPLVPYHNLPKLHELVKEYCPEPYNGIIETYKEI